MDKYRPCPSIIAMFTSDSQHPPRSKHAVYLGGAAKSTPSLLNGYVASALRHASAHAYK